MTCGRRKDSCIVVVVVIVIGDGGGGGPAVNANTSRRNALNIWPSGARELITYFSRTTVKASRDARARAIAALLIDMLSNSA